MLPIGTWLEKCIKLFTMEVGVYKSAAEMENLWHRLVDTNTFPYSSHTDQSKNQEVLAKTLVMDRSVTLGTTSPLEYYIMEFDEHSVFAGPLEKYMLLAILNLAEIPPTFLETTNLPDTVKKRILCALFAEQTTKCALLRRPGLSGKGFVGILLASSLPGDKLVILYGASIPFVIRKVGNYHRIIGGCYVHGAMKGDMVVDSPYPRERFDFQ